MTKTWKVVISASIILTSTLTLSAFANLRFTHAHNLQHVHNISGKEFCEGSHPGFSTCIPVYNAGADGDKALIVYFQGTAKEDKIDYGYATAALASSPISSIHATVRIENGNTIFSGEARNLEGLKCTESGCVKWTD